MEWILKRRSRSWVMNWYRPGLWVVLLFIPCINAFPQGLAALRFDKEVHHFDTIPEEGGLATTVFTVYNDGDAVLRLSEVKAACGCTSEEWTRIPIAPGDSGFIRVHYDPSNRPGYFKKPVSVKSNDPSRIHTLLLIEGYVRPRPKTIEELFPFKQGGLRFREEQLTFGYASTDSLLTDTFMFINTSDKMIMSTKLPAKYRKKWYRTEMVPANVPPGEVGKVVINYDPGQRKEWGLLFDKVYFATNDTEEEFKELRVSLNIQFDFSKLSKEELDAAPILKVEPMQHRFGSVKSGSIVKASFVLSNQGKTDLDILRISQSCKCISWKLQKETLKAGEIQILEVEMNTRELKGPQHKTITIVSNSPQNHQVIISLIGFVN